MPDSNLKRLLGDPREIAVERALAEIRSGRPVVIVDGETRLLTIAVESVDDAMLALLMETGNAAENNGAVAENNTARLVLSPPRARLLGFPGPEPAIMALTGVEANALHEIVSHTGAHLDGQKLEPANDRQKYALDLVRLAYLLPAAITVPLASGKTEGVQHEGMVCVTREAIRHYLENVITSLRIVARAPVPLEEVGDTEFVVFRGGEGMRDQIAVIIGKPNPNEPVYVRLHSACLTGDLFGSLKCDCGDQLRGTVRNIAEMGGGILLYLDQEGRGSGIANKIRAYHLQHCGYDTFDADEILGFGIDQRRFDFAAAMLRQLGHTSIRLMTNNPGKVLALQEAGLDVVSSHPVKARLTLQNAGYLVAKRDRAGHKIEGDLKT
ncbi:MAG: GTP cyclohydrolase II RibA [Alphaproteobacteria bacterium]